MIPAVVTAGGRLSAELAERAGTPVKALARVGGTPLLIRMLDALAALPEVGPILLVGPVDELQGVVADREVQLVPEGATGPENIHRALAALSPEEKNGRVLLCTSDLPFVTAEAIRYLMEKAPEDADIVFPVIGREAFEAAFPGSPNIYARLAGKEYTGGSVLLVRPQAIEANLPLIESVFAARKSQFGMARLLGLTFLFRFLTGTLTVTQAEARASVLTGCRCRALMEAPPPIAADVDTLPDFEWADRFTADVFAPVGDAEKKTLLPTGDRSR